MEINLISDTVTRPTEGMMKAMWSADVGDDVFRQDPAVNALEAKVASMFNHEAALFCPSGTMTNQIAIRIHTQPLDEIICDETAHIYLYELGGYAFNSGVGIQIVRGKNGIMQADQIRQVIRPKADWYPTSKLVTLENSCNRAGGGYYTLDDIAPIRQLCDEHGMALHLDGARLFNVLVETEETTQAYGEMFDTISICLSKGLGAPVGSLLTGPADLINRARKVRKVMGGGMRQAGYLAAAGIYALDNHVELLRKDNARAKEIGSLLSTLPGVAEVLPVYTNIVIFKLASGKLPIELIEELKSHGVLAAPMSHDTVRFVFHLDVTEEMFSLVKKIAGELLA